MSQNARKKILLVGWDSADWKVIQLLIDSGAMPGLAGIVERGVSGNLTTLEPQLSPMLWTSIATGKMAYHHGEPGFTEVDPETNQVVPVSADTRKCSTLWEILGDHGLKTGFTPAGENPDQRVYLLTAAEGLQAMNEGWTGLRTGLQRK